MYQKYFVFVCIGGFGK